MNLPQLVFTGVTTFAPAAAIGAGLQPLEGKKLALVPAPPHPHSALKLAAKDARFLQVLKRQPPFDELAAEMKQTADEVVRKVYALYVLGYLDDAEKVARAAPPANSTASAPPSAPAQSTKAGPAPEEVERLRNEVTASYLKHRTQDPLDLFGLDESAPAPLEVHGSVPIVLRGKNCQDTAGQVAVP